MGTFNALYYDLQTAAVSDPSCQGFRDLSAGIVRAPHPKGIRASIEEDPLRLLRAFRFAARFSFSLEREVESGVDEEALNQLRSMPQGRALYEVKKAFLLHNRPSRFFSAGGENMLSWLLGDDVDSLSRGTWQSVGGRVRRLEELVLEGLARGLLRSRSAVWRGRRSDGPPAALLATDWRKLGIGENDWAELLLAALLWHRSPGQGRRNGAGITDFGKRAIERLQLSTAMVENIRKLQTLAGSRLLAVHTVPPGALILHAAIVEQRDPKDFWDRWPRCPSASGSYEWTQSKPWR